MGRWHRSDLYFVARPILALGAYETANFIAARASNRVVLGHWAETLNWDVKMDEVERIYRAETNDYGTKAI